MESSMDDDFNHNENSEYEQSGDYGSKNDFKNQKEAKSKSSLKKEHKRAVHNKLSRALEKKRLRKEFNNINGWL